MKKILTLVVALIAICNANAKSGQPTELNLRIGTYNVWADSARKSPIKRQRALPSRSWEHSKQAVAELIVKLNCDIIGLQEVSDVCRDDIKELVKKAGGKRYKMWWENSYPEGMRIIGNAVLYDKRMFKIEKKAVYFYSPTPEVSSNGWDCTKFYRTALTSVITHKKSGKKFFFIATHCPLRPIAKGHAGRLLVEFDKKYNTDKLPTIVVGDMNSHPGDEFHQTMLTYYDDSFHVAEKKCATLGTFNGPGEVEKQLSQLYRRIDHIYTHSTENGKVTVKEYDVNRDKFNCGGRMHYPSDHNPVVVNLTIK